MKKILTAAELARLLKVSNSYICRLCRLPKTHPKYIQAEKIHAKMYIITDEKILAKYGNKYCSDI